MKVEIEDISGVEKRVEIEIPAERVDDEIEEQYKELKGKAHVKGFRPGKAPRKLLERLFKDYVQEAVIKKLVEETLETALARKSIEPVVEPVIDPSELSPGKDYTYTAHVEVKPTFEPTDYKGLKVTHTDESVKDQDVEETINRMREAMALIREPEVERPVRMDDQVTAAVSIREGDKELVGGEDPEQVIELWRDTWIPGLAERLEGHSIGETVTFTAEAPEDERVPEEFANKKLDFSFIIRVIKEREIPELNDEFIEQNTKYKTVDELRESVHQDLIKRVERDNRGRLEFGLMEELISKNPIDVPPGLIKREAMSRAKGFIQRTTQREPTNEEAEKFTDMFTEEAKKLLQASYLLEAIAEKESIEADDDEVEEWIGREAEKYEMNVDKYKDLLGKEGLVAAGRQAVMDRTLDFLIAHATIKEEAKKEK